MSALLRGWTMLALAISTVLLAIILDIGYPLLSLEAGLLVAAAALTSLPLGFAFGRIPWILRGFLSFAVATILDIFLIDSDLWSIAAYFGFLLFSLVTWRFVQNEFFLMFLMVMLVGVYLQRPSEFGLEKVAERGRISSGPLVVHLILDEMGSFESVPTTSLIDRDIEFLRNEYAARGFRVFDGIQSLSSNTQFSLSNLMMNADGRVNLLKKRGQFDHALDVNDIHRKYLNAGWSISVLQSDFLNLCDARLIEVSCRTYSRAGNANRYLSEEILITMRARLLAAEVAAFLVSRGRGLNWLALLENSVPSLLSPFWPVRASSPSRTLEMLHLMSEEANRLSTHRGKSLAVLHLLVPHYPWMLDRRCQMKMPDVWVIPKRKERSMQKQEAIIAAYWEQAYCVHLNVLSLIDRLDRDVSRRVSFVIHGDHGPRIFGAELRPSKILMNLPYDHPVRKNYLEAFFAIRSSEGKQLMVSTETSLQSAVREFLVDQVD